MTEHPILDVRHRSDAGAYSDVFFYPATRIAYKLFISRRHPTNVSQMLTSRTHEQMCRQVFEDECLAYRIAIAIPTLAPHVPRFFGSVHVADVLDASGKSLSEQYLLGCCYGMEWVEGPVKKLYNWDLEAAPHLEGLVRMFHQAGIRYTRDASVINGQDCNAATLIDFGTREFVVEHEELPLDLDYRWPDLSS